MKKFFIIPGLVLLAVIGLRLSPNLISSSSHTDDETGAQYAQHLIHNYACSTPTSCKITTNVPTVLIDGIYVDVGENFVKECEENLHNPQGRNRYCSQIVMPGNVRFMQADARLIKHMLEYDGAVRPEDGLQERTDAALAKIWRG